MFAESESKVMDDGCYLRYWLFSRTEVYPFSTVSKPMGIQDMSVTGG
jgi:hypothetical protein